MKPKPTVWIPLIFFLSTFTPVLSQSTFTGRVVDQNGGGIPYVSIFSTDRKYGVVSDEFGDFRISTKSAIDSIAFSAVGFEKVTIKFQDLLKNSTIVLNEKTYLLDEFSVQNKKTSWLGFKGEKPNRTVVNQITNFSEFGLIITDIGDYGFLKKVKVKAGFGGNPKLPMRINLYRLGPDGLPEENILKEPIVFTPQSKRLKWYEFDIYEQHIRFPEGGLCIGLEFLNPSTNDNNYSSKDGPVYLGFNQSGFIQVRRTYRTDWEVIPEVVSRPAVSVEVEVE